MLLTKIHVKNYRLLVDAWMDVDSSMTLIVGRNNTAKTSCMDIIEKVLKGSSLSYDDYPLNKRQNLFDLITSFMKKDITFEELNQNIEVTSVEFTVDYSLDDPESNLGALSPFIIDVDVDTTSAIIRSEYGLKLDEKYLFELFEAGFYVDGTFEPNLEEVRDIYNASFSKIFGLKIYAVNPKNSGDTQIKTQNELATLFPFFAIPAERILGEDGAQNNNSLGTLITNYFSVNVDELASDVSAEIKTLRKVVEDANKTVQRRSDELLSSVVNKAIGFGYPNAEELQLGVSTKLKIAEQITDHTKLTYMSDVIGETLPSSHNGLGYKDIILPHREAFRIVSFNTALLSFVRKYPDDQMLIGQPQVMELLEHNLIGDNRNHFTIALFHHAERFLHTHEICEYDHRYATLPLLRRYVDLILCGHTETGGIPVLYKQIGGAEMLTGGAAYYSDDHANAYSMVIAPDNLSEGKEREVILYPFTYSAESGWHHNIRKALPMGYGSIVAEQPTFNCRADFQLVLSYEDQILSIPMKCVSVYIHGDNTALLSNSEDVCRNLDIICSGPTDKPGKSNVSISIACTKENSVESFLVCETVFAFLNRATNSKSGSSFEIVDASGNVFLSGENISCNEKIEDEGIEFLTKLRRIELEYDLIFQCPKDNAEYRKVDILNDLIENGYTTAFNAIPGFETYSANKKQLFKIGLLALLNRPVYILHRGNFRCRLYGNDFSLGKAMVSQGMFGSVGKKYIYYPVPFLSIFVFFG